MDRDWTQEDYQALNPDGLRSINNAMEFIKNPRKMCNEIAGYVQRMCDVINHHKVTRPSETDPFPVYRTILAHCLYQSETWDLAQRRWSKELREFQKRNKNGEVEYDISKIPDIYDNIKVGESHTVEIDRISMTWNTTRNCARDRRATSRGCISPSKIWPISSFLRYSSVFFYWLFSRNTV